METPIPGFRSVPKTGVIYVMSEAAKYGFSYDHPAWANLGQGSPETGPIPDAPPRINNLTIDPTSHRLFRHSGKSRSASEGCGLLQPDVSPRKKIPIHV